MAKPKPQAKDATDYGYGPEYADMLPEDYEPPASNRTGVPVGRLLRALGEKK